jgi:hypothetical protein
MRGGYYARLEDPMSSVFSWLGPARPRRGSLQRYRLPVAACLLVQLLSPHAVQAQANECAPLGRSAALRADGKLSAARAELASCMEASECNADARRRCAAEQQTLANEMPSVVVHAHDGRGNDLVDVSVTLDGEPFVSKLDGLALSIDPGEHKFVFTRAGQEPVEQSALIEAKDKFKLVTVELPDAELLRQRAQSESPAERPARSPERLIAGLSLAGVGVAGIVAFAVVGADARDEEQELEDLNCKPDCSQGRVDSVSTRYTIANVSLVVGIASLGAAAWVLLTGSSATPANPSAQVDVVAGPRGGTLTLKSHF